MINYFITCKYNLIQYFFFTKNVIEEFYNCYLIVNKLLKEKNVLKKQKATSIVLANIKKERLLTTNGDRCAATYLAMHIFRKV